MSIEPETVEAVARALYLSEHGTYAFAEEAWDDPAETEGQPLWRRRARVALEVAEAGTTADVARALYLFEHASSPQAVGDWDGTGVPGRERARWLARAEVVQHTAKEAKMRSHMSTRSAINRLLDSPEGSKNQVVVPRDLLSRTVAELNSLHRVLDSARTHLVGGLMDHDSDRPAGPYELWRAAKRAVDEIEVNLALIKQS